MAKIWSYLRFTFLLLLFTSIGYVLYLNPFSSEFWSAHTLYRYKLAFSDYSEEEVAEWKAAASIAFADSLFIEPPIALKVGKKEKNNTAWVYQMNLREGEKLKVELQAKNNLFADLYYLPSDDSPQHLKSFDNLASLTILETGLYYLRLQAPGGEPVAAGLSLRTAPIYDVFPVEGKGNKAIQSFWGAPRDGGRRKHEGIDIFAAKGTPLLAVCDGKIDRVGNSRLGGKTVWLYDSKLDQSIYYAHLDEQNVSVGDYVKAGDQIGTVGNTGNARTTPTHLHLGIYLQKAIDPLAFVQRQEQETSVPSYLNAVGKDAQVKVRTVRVYRSAHTKDKADIVLMKGTKVKVIGAAKGFVHIETDLGKAFFMKGEQLKVVD